VGVLFKRPEALVIPTEPAQLTSEWLTQALRSSGFEGVEVVRAEVRVLSVQADSHSRYARVRPEYARPGAGLPQSLFVKLTARSSPVPVLGHLYAREIGFHREIAPHLPVRVPKLYYGAASPDGSSGVLVLEDLGGARQGDSVAGVSRRDFVNAADALARLHARWWDQPDLDRWPFLFELPSDPSFFRAPLLRALEAGVAEAEELGGYVGEVARRLAERCDAWIARVRRGPRTLAHFDFRPENLCFGVDGDDDGLAILDWGLVGRGPGAYDVANFAIRSLLPASPEEALEPLWIYSERLREHGVRRPRETLLDEYRAATLLFLWEWLGNVAIDPERAYGRAMLRRGARHCEQARAGDAL
jgi:aminoglycoside phosphotransferase (APT) family kinase protein